MEFKKDYFLDNIKELGINSLSEYLKNSPYNYVILENNVPLVFASDNAPVIYGGIEDVNEQLNELAGYKNDAVKDSFRILKDNFRILTERNFIISFCLDAVADYIAKKVITYGRFDGTNYVLNTDDSFNGIINIDGMTDILGIYASNNSDSELSILISSRDDKEREFITLSELNFDNIIKIVKLVESDTDMY